MKPGSQFVMLVLFAAGMQSAHALKCRELRKELTPEKIPDNAADVLVDEMTPEARDLLVTMFTTADKNPAGGTQPYLFKDDPRWKSAGFHRMTPTERMVFRRVHEHCGRELIFTADYLVVFPHIQTRRG